MESNFRLALRKAMISECEALIPAEIPYHEFSAGFEKKINRLLKHGKPALSFKKLGIFIAIAAIVAVLAAVGTGAFESLFKQFSFEHHETHTVVKSTDTEGAPRVIEELYMFDVPEGFECSYTEEPAEWMPFINHFYQNEAENKYLNFMQTVKNKYNVNVNTEDRVMEYIAINGHDGYIIDLWDNEYLISWDNGDYILEIIGNLGRDGMIRLAESVKVVENLIPETIEDIYTISYDLSGYEYNLWLENDISRCAEYRKGDKIINFEQWTKAEYDILLNTEGAEIEKTNIYECEAFYFCDNHNYHHYIWDGGYYIFSIGSNLDKETVYEIAKSLRKEEKYEETSE